MPELPDVESTRRYLVSQGLVGRTVSGVELLWPRETPSARLPRRSSSRAFPAAGFATYAAGPNT